MRTDGGVPGAWLSRVQLFLAIDEVFDVPTSKKDIIGLS